MTPAGRGVQARAGDTTTAPRATRSPVLVVKLGGRALEAPGALSECATALREAGQDGHSARAHAPHGHPTIVIHGGGAEVTAWSAKLGLPARFADGLRVTDAATLDVATAVLAGLANKRLVAVLRSHGLDAVGLAALDGGIARVRRHTESATLGEVGEIESVDPSLLESLMAQGRTPVLASLGDDGEGALLNLNADDVAAAVAAALPASELLLLSDTPGLVIGGELVRTLDPDALERALAHPDVGGGMRPKLRAARLALAAGVARVHIAAWQGPGTIAAVLAGRATATTCTGPGTGGADAAPALAHQEVGLLAPLYPLPRLELVQGRGAWVRDAGGREYLDFTSGIAVNAFGHAPRGLAEMLAAQLAHLGHCSNLFANEPALALASELTEATGYARVFFCNSGTEGLDAGLKFARAHARARGRAGRGIVAFQGGFHGRTGFALSATYNPSYREPFEPLIPGVRFAPYNDVAALDAVLDAGVCAAVVECVQGEAGAVPGTREFLYALRARCTELGALLVVDEVQTGMGRTGHLLAQEHFGVRGDVTVLSKALGAGLPIAAVLMTEEVAGSLAPGMHGCTFGGNAVCAAAARWSLAQVRQPAFLARVRHAAERLASGLAALAARHATVREARGLGLLTALELIPGGVEPAALVTAARDAGLLLVRGGERAVRLLPPLTVTDDELDQGLERLDAALAAATAAATVSANGGGKS